MNCTMNDCHKPATYAYYSTVNGIRCRDAAVCLDHHAQIQAIDPKVAAAKVAAAQKAGLF